MLKRVSVGILISDYFDTRCIEIASKAVPHAWDSGRIKNNWDNEYQGRFCDFKDENEGADSYCCTHREKG